MPRPEGADERSPGQRPGEPAATYNQHFIHHTQPSPERAAQHVPTRRTFGHGCDAWRRLFSLRAEMSDCLLRGSPFTPRDVWNTSRPTRRTGCASFAQRALRCSPPRCRGKGDVATPPGTRFCRPFRAFACSAAIFLDWLVCLNPQGVALGYSISPRWGCCPQPG